MKSINEIILTAGLTRDAEVKTYQDRNGKPFYNCSLSLGFNKTEKNQDGVYEDVPMYINGHYLCRSEKIIPLLTKGTQVLVVASIDQFVTKESQRITSLNIRDLRLMGAPKTSSAPAAGNTYQNDSSSGADDGYVPF